MIQLSTAVLAEEGGEGPQLGTETEGGEEAEQAEGTEVAEGREAEVANKVQGEEEEEEESAAEVEEVRNFSPLLQFFFIKRMKIIKSTEIMIFCALCDQDKDG